MGKGQNAARIRNAEKRVVISSLVDDVREMLLARGMYLRVSEPAFGGKRNITTFHWMIEDEQGHRIVDYWPVSGTWYCGRNGERGTCADPFLIVEVASKLCGGK